jgi:hypothetical protein
MKAVETRAPARTADRAKRMTQPAHAGAAHASPELPAGAVIQRKAGCACGGGCPRCQQSASPRMKLNVSSPGDRYEQEADRVADHVMRMPAPASAAAAPKPAGAQNPARIQRVCFPPGNVGQEDEELKRQQAAAPIQTKPKGQSRPPASVEAHPHLEALSGGGRHLPENVRSFFEPRFGHDFSHVRVHTGARAEGLAQSVNARAYTLGRDIVFGAGQYTPGTTEGRKLLAHELTHVVQQGGGQSHAGAVQISRMENDGEPGLQRKLCLGGGSASGLLSMLNGCAGLGGMRLTDEACADCPSGFQTVELFAGPPTSDILTTTLWDVLTDQAKTYCWRGVSNDPSVFMDQFITRSMDIGDIGNLPATAPSAFPSATTLCEAFAHNVVEFRNADKNTAGFGPSHALGLAAQGTFRAQRGQQGAVANQVLMGAGHGVTIYSNGASTHTFFSGGNVTSITHQN